MEGSKNNRRKPDRRIPWLTTFIMLLFSVLGIYLGKVMLKDAPGLRQKAQNQLINFAVLPARRGDILDRNGTLLATSATSFRLDADLIMMRHEISSSDDVDRLNAEDTRKLEKYASESANLIAQVTGGDPAKIAAELTKKTQGGVYYAIANIGTKLEISRMADVEKLKREKKLRWLILNEDSKRYYPDNSLLAQTIGIVDKENKGLFGLEKYYDRYLSGVNGLKISEVDKYNEDIPMNEPVLTSPVDGYQTKTTIDERIQEISEKAADKALKEKGANGVSIVVMRPKTGEILALVNSPGFDLNDPYAEEDPEKLQQLWKNKVVTDSFEPGSIFKMVTMIAALSEGKVDEHDVFDCPGYIMVDGEKIYCADHNGHGRQDYYQIMQNSCNPGFITLGLRLGPEKIIEYARKLGFGDYTGVDLPAEARGILFDPKKAKNVDTAAMSIGQTNSVTALQMLGALNTVLNKGVRTIPHVVNEINAVKADGKISNIFRFKETNGQKVLDEKVTDKVMSIMEETVNKGGSHLASVEGVRVLGKTGTAQKLNPATGKYEYWVSSFIGAAPVEDPQISIFVSIDTPTQGSELAGVISAPIAGEILKNTMEYINQGISQGNH